MSESVVRLHEYSAAASVTLSTQPAVAFPSSLHNGSEKSAIIPLDVSKELGCTATPATSPNLLASFLRIQVDQPLITFPNASSQVFYVIRGSGVSSGVSTGDINWVEGDCFTLPGTECSITHTATSPSSLYWVHDQPLLHYLGVTASSPPRFAPALYTNVALKKRVEEIRHEPSAEGRNRMGVLLGHEATEDETKTLTPILWALLNTLPPKTAQPPHRHNSVALDLCVDAPASGVYTLMGPKLGKDGWVDPDGAIKMHWQSGAVFTTPPGWWHSHHNETGVCVCCTCIFFSPTCMPHTLTRNPITIRQYTKYSR